MVLAEICCDFWLIFWKIESFWMDKFPTGQMLLQEFPKDSL